MKTLVTAIIIGITVLSCTNIKEPQFRRVESFNVKKLALTQVDLGFRITYYNPNKFGVNVKEAAADVYVDSVYIGKFVQEEQVDVNREAEFSIPLIGSISLSTALKLKGSDVTNREFLVSANGSVKVGKAGVFVNRPFTYSGKHQLNLRL